VADVFREAHKRSKSCLATRFISRGPDEEVRATVLFSLGCVRWVVQFTLSGAFGRLGRLGGDIGTAPSHYLTE